MEADEDAEDDDDAAVADDDAASSEPSSRVAGGSSLDVRSTRCNSSTPFSISIANNSGSSAEHVTDVLEDSPFSSSSPLLITGERCSCNDASFQSGPFGVAGKDHGKRSMPRLPSGRVGEERGVGPTLLLNDAGVRTDTADSEAAA